MSSINDLRKELKKYGLPTYGNKAELRDRLYDHLEMNNSSSSEDSDPCNYGGVEDDRTAYDVQYERNLVFDNRDEIRSMDMFMKDYVNMEKPVLNTASYKDKLRVLKKYVGFLEKEYLSNIKNDEKFNYEFYPDYSILQIVIGDLQGLS